MTVVPPPELRFRRRVRVRQAAVELWRARELVATLAERELRTRYKQAVLGFAWALIPPVGLMLVFTFFVRHVGHVSTQGTPYQLYAYLGLLPWTFFTASVMNGGVSLVVNVPLLNKVYCPREVFPIASVAAATFDGLISTLVLLVLFPLNSRAPQPTTYWVPLLLAIQLLFTLGVVLLVAGVVVYLRDVRHLLPIALQLGLFITPVAYSLHSVPRHLRGLYVAANPLGAVIDGYRRCVLLGRAPDLHLVAVAGVSSTCLFVLAFWAFKRLETGVADVA